MDGPVRSRLTKVTAAAFGLAVIASGCAKDAPQTTLKPKGPKAESINNLINPVFIVAGIVFVGILGGALFVALKFRAKDNDDFHEFPEQVHGNFKVEITWTILPAVILAAISIPTVAMVLDLYKKPPAEALPVQVVGQQWWWEYRYDTDADGKYDDIVTANDLVIPTGREISLDITSRDVIHSFWAPALNGKKDAVPGRHHPWSIEADSPGEYIGQCTEYCGLSHAEMRIKVVAMSPDDYDQWVEDQQKPFENPTSTEAQAGWSTFAGQCTTCHRITGMTDPASAEDPADADEVFKYPASKAGKDNPQSGALNQESGAAPNLTKLMSRTTFAGAKFDLRKDTKECRALGENWASTDDGIAKCLNHKDLEAWLRNAPLEKAMAPGETMNPHSRGMPNFNLTEEQIDQLVAFLSTLK